MEYEELFARTELLVGKESMKAIASKRMILFGLGGVGSWCAEGLIRSGVMHLTMVDPDRVAPSNINRQLPATTQTIGQLKVEVMKNRLLEINPFVEIKAVPQMYSEETSTSFHLETYDYVIDAIDTLQQKAHLLSMASKTPATVFSSMGAALKIDPQQIRVAEFQKVKGCKLAAALRRHLRDKGKPVKPILCVYSEEHYPNKGTTIEKNKNDFFRREKTNGTVVHVTAVFGFTLTALVIQDILSKCDTPPFNAKQ
ncbi:MAG TPA: tRNA threonylcarbamoyladenosine dehydratase [Dysgonamonadaceae bacterium]|nr:tRNA threonylcarbamoyladenosine dehydratase [Dysgonamonadaceae bacterium]